MKWLSRMRLPKSFHAPIRRAEAEKESTPCLLFAQQPNPAGRQREEKRGKRVGRVGWERRLVWGYRWGRRRSHCRFHSLFFRQLGFSKRRSSARPSRHTHTQTCTARADTHTHLQKHTNPLEPPETSDQGVSPPNTSSPHPPPLISLCHSVLSESATKRTVKEKDGEEKKAKSID